MKRVYKVWCQDWGDSEEDSLEFLDYAEDLAAQQWGENFLYNGYYEKEDKISVYVRSPLGELTLHDVYFYQVIEVNASSGEIVEEAS